MRRTWRGNRRSGRSWLNVAAVLLLASGAGLWAQPTPPPDTQPATPQQQATPATMPSAAEMIEVLQRDRQIDVPIPPSEPPERPGEIHRHLTPPIAPTGEQPMLMPEGTFVVDRPGRLVREGEWWTFVFESADGNVRHDPLRLLPSRQVEIMEQTSDGGARSVVFVVSGEITEYHGRNYLLLRKVLVRRDLGNLK